MKKLALIIILLAFTPIFAQVEFVAKVSKSTVGLNERFRIEFQMNEDGDNFIPPGFENFRVLSGPMQQVSQSWINGKSSFNKSYVYILLPTSKGEFTIKPASIEINGENYKSNAIKISVTNAIDVPKNPNDVPQVSANDAVKLVAEVSKTNPYINEPITVVYKLYFNYNVSIRDYKQLNKPTYNNFWSQNIDMKQLTIEDGSLNGEKMAVVVLKKTVLYPQKSGALTIEPLSLELDLELPTNRRNFFGQYLTVREPKKVTAGAKTIKVKDLPTQGKPEDFSGAVGVFNFTAVPTRTSLKHGESLDLNVKVSGTGNLKLFELPKPIVPAALEVYDPVRNEQVSTPLSGTTGFVSEKYTIVPQYKGSYAIKPLKFSYFDLKTNQYKTIQVPEIMIDVLDGPELGTPPTTVSGSAVAKNAISATDQFQFIKLQSNLQPKSKSYFLGSTFFYILILLPFVAIPLIILFKKKKEAMDSDVVGNKIRVSNKLAKKYLSEAKNQIQNKEMFYVSLEKAMHNFLKAKLNIETSEMSKDKIREILLQKNAKLATVDAFISLTENCELARYAPSSSSAIQNDYEKGVEIISALAKQI